MILYGKLFHYPHVFLIGIVLTSAASWWMGLTDAAASKFSGKPEDYLKDAEPSNVKKWSVIIKGKSKNATGDSKSVYCNAFVVNKMWLATGANCLFPKNELTGLEDPAAWDVQLPSIYNENPFSQSNCLSQWGSSLGLKEPNYNHMIVKRRFRGQGTSKTYRSRSSKTFNKNGVRGKEQSRRLFKSSSGRFQGKGFQGQMRSKQEQKQTQGVFSKGNTKGRYRTSSSRKVSQFRIKSKPGAANSMIGGMGGFGGGFMKGMGWGSDFKMPGFTSAWGTKSSFSNSGQREWVTKGGGKGKSFKQEQGQNTEATFSGNGFKGKSKTKKLRGRKKTSIKTKDGFMTSQTEYTSSTSNWNFESLKRRKRSVGLAFASLPYIPDQTWICDHLKKSYDSTIKVSKIKKHKLTAKDPKTGKVYDLVLMKLAKPLGAANVEGVILQNPLIHSVSDQNFASMMPLTINRMNQLQSWINRQMIIG